MKIRKKRKLRKAKYKYLTERNSNDNSGNTGKARNIIVQVPDCILKASDPAKKEQKRSMRMSWWSYLVMLAIYLLYLFIGAGLIF